MDVLIVDDSAAVRKIMKRVLQTEIHIGEVYEAADGCEAILRLGEKAVQLIISEIRMPNMDGLQLLARIKSTPQWNAIPVVMVTAEGSEQKVLEAIELGAVGYVKKPFNAEKIKRTLAGIV